MSSENNSDPADENEPVEINLLNVAGEENEQNAVVVLDNNNASSNRRNRRLQSQPTVEEDVLDNEQLNRQQQFEEDMSNGSEEESVEDFDQLFEEYIRQNDPIIEEYNRELPIEHSYLGSMDIVSGINFYETDKVYQIPICGHHSLVFPGEILPMIISESIFENESSEGLIFGLVFWENTRKIDKDNKKEIVYGVTCQVYERGVDTYGHITLKSRAHQRFQIIPKDGNLTTSKHTDRGRKFFANVRILPEVVLPDPIICLNTSNNLLKFLHNPSQYNKIKEFIARSNVWPKFVYDQYEIVSVMQKVERFLAMLNMIEKVPTDPIALSFWLARNIPLTSEERLNIFITNCVTTRMLIIGRSLNFSCKLTCKRCYQSISVYNDIFAMSKNGVQSNYCNPAGYIHETLTVYKVIENSLRMTQAPSTDFSWFPGYAWQIAVCSRCSVHIGWKFIAVNKNLKPKSFYGLSGKSITVDTKEGKSTKNNADEINANSNLTVVSATTDDDDDDDNDDD